MSRVVGQGNGANPTGAPANGYGPLLQRPPTAAGVVGSSNLYAQILAGSNSGIVHWQQFGRGRDGLAESHAPRDLAAGRGHAGSPPLQYVGSYLISNVLNLSGMRPAELADLRPQRHTASQVPETDPFVLQMNYDTAPLER